MVVTSNVPFKLLEVARFTQFSHIKLSDLGFIKRGTEVTAEAIENITNMVNKFHNNRSLN